MSYFNFTKAGVQLVEKLEGLRLTAYRDTGGVWTVGYGHTGPDVPHNTSITQERAEELLMQDLAHAMDAVRGVVEWNSFHLQITQNQFSALVIFAYNVGANAFENSTLAADLGEYDSTDKVYTPSIVQELRRWNKVKGVVVQGLVNRREAEIALWNTPDAA
jgi:lysozyme